MSIDDKLASLPGDEEKRRQLDEEHARRVKALADALSALSEPFSADLGTSPETVPLTPQVKDQLARLDHHRGALDTLITRVKQRYIPQGADVYDWSTGGRNFTYASLTPAELAASTYPAGKLIEGGVTFAHGPLKYESSHYLRNDAPCILLTSDGHCDMDDFSIVLNRIQEHYACYRDELSGDSRGIRAIIPAPLPTAAEFTNLCTTLYGTSPFALGPLRVIYSGITREEFERATLPTEKILHPG